MRDGSMRSGNRSRSVPEAIPCTMQRTTRWRYARGLTSCAMHVAMTRQDMAGALATLPSSHVKSQFLRPRSTFSTRARGGYGGLDVPIFEKEEEPPPLSMQISERLSEWRLRRNDRADVDRPTRRARL